MDLISQVRYDESRVYLRLARLGETAERPPLELAWLYSRALQLLCDLGFQDEAFRECLNGLARLSSASCSADPRSADTPALIAHETMLYVQAFGTLRIRGGSARVSCPIWRGSRGRTLALFELLVCFGDQPVAEELAIESLWPEASAESGRRDLKITLHRLRHQLEPRLESGDRSRYIVLRQGFLSFHPEFFVSDVTQFDVAIRRGRRNESDGRVEAACADYQQAVALYEGPLLGEERYCDWVVEPRRRREKQLLASLRTLGSWAEERQDLPRATQWYEAYLNGDPCAEGIVQRLMRVHVRLGQRSEAVRAYVALHGVLAEELNTCPSPETEALYRSLRP
jgi:DNA-binding SARP family transcriptional activator